MKQLIIRLSEFVSIVCLAAFIIFVSSEKPVSEKNAAEIFEAVSTVIDLENVSEQDATQLKKQYGIGESEIDSFVYYNSEDVMDVTELLIIKVTDEEKAQQIVSAVDSVLSENKTMFESYAPQQSAILKKAVLVYERGFVLFAAGEDSAAALEVFNNNL